MGRKRPGKAQPQGQDSWPRYSWAAADPALSGARKAGEQVDAPAPRAQQLRWHFLGPTSFPKMGLLESGLSCLPSA